MRRLVSFALIAIATPAAAQQEAPATSKPAAEKKVCRPIQTTGSMMAKRVCHSKAEWASIDATNGQNADRALSQRRTTRDRM